jgi:hypothetical protein
MEAAVSLCSSSIKHRRSIVNTTQFTQKFAITSSGCVQKSFVHLAKTVKFQQM